jgi:hypothetical protein
LGNVITGTVSLYHEEPIGVSTILEDGGSGFTADSTSRNLQASSGGILDLEGTGEIVHNGRDKLVLDVVSHRATRGAEETSVEIGSEVGVTGEGSAVMFVITIGVEVFFNVDDFGFLMIMVIVSTFMFKSVVEGKETDEDEAC